MRTGAIHQLFSEINGIPTYIETVQSTGTAATSNTLPRGARLLVQADAACYIRVGATTEVGIDGVAVTAVSSTNGLKLAADEKFFLCLNEDNFPKQGIAAILKIQVISVSGTVNLKVFRLD